MRIGLVTTHFAINYGAVLQAYALRRSIEKLGNDCEILNYSPLYSVSGREVVYRFNTLRNILFSTLLICNYPFRKKTRDKVSKFDNFLNKYCKLTKQTYSSYLDMRKKMPEYDILICGSDQIWNLNLVNDPAFFLRFEDKYPDSKYIAYGPSIAEKLLPDQYNELKGAISHFSAISIREKDGAEIVSKLTNKPIKNVLDPVLLLDQSEWSEIAEPLKIEKPYLLCYSIADDVNFNKALRILKKKLNLKLVCINLTPFNKFKADILLTDISPENFVWLFKNAEFVCTSSFHGTAFSVLFEKQFFTIPGKKRASRHESLLEQLALKNRLLFDLSLIDNENEIEKIDFDYSSFKLRELKQESINYLISSLAGKS